MNKFILFLALLFASIAAPPFSAPVNAGSLLQRYETGTFTPTLLFGGAAVGMTGTFSGHYTRIGNRVFFNIDISLTAKGSSTGSPVTVGGLPFTSSNAAGNYATSAAQAFTAVLWVNPVAYIAPGGTTLNLGDQTGATTAGITDAYFTNTTELMISGSYSI